MNGEQRARLECIAWQHRMMKQASWFTQAAQSVQRKVNERIPQKVHDAMTEAVKGMVQTVLTGSEWTTSRHPVRSLSFLERERLIREKILTYRRLAAVEGAGTGAGGILLGLADFPMLLSLKMKFLYDVASLYGFDVTEDQERLYLLHIFQVTFSSGEKRTQAFLKLRNWHQTIQTFPSTKQMDWQAFQQDYRETIDLPKLLQLIPGFGAIVGAVVNHRFLNELGKTAMNAYRMRLLDSSGKSI
ncbi:EcsC family protein [Desmospora profundinema]|uniref:Uncharacterized protein (DUF697 family) n=1 Tax=Desmospora profundinema TaxID=1571184 RepID=A0ABU1IIR5_9BACL|nr:EcsC family protein [Desmospora profundinema]MDR6224298.1 uncharacterized protein (DUF697 family) [Desmospora profundinema]